MTDRIAIGNRLRDALAGLSGWQGPSAHRRLWRRVAFAVCAGIVIGIAVSNLIILPEVRNQWGEDYRFFVRAAVHWQDTGSFYLPHQLAGPYEAQTAVDVLYPPPALALFLPFTVLPAPLWWAVPLGIVAASVVLWRPAWWAWPVIALLAWLPRSGSIVIWGNTGMWVAAAVAVGLRLPGAAVLVLAKPTFAPLALIGARRRSWWAALVAFALLQLSALALWSDYVMAMRNNVGSWPPGPLYSLPDYAFVAIPVVAWLARRRPNVEDAPTTPSHGSVGPPAGRSPQAPRGAPDQLAGRPATQSPS